MDSLSSLFQPVIFLSCFSLIVMTWCFYLLGTHLDIQEKLYQEIVEVLGDEEVTFENTRQLK